MPQLVAGILLGEFYRFSFYIVGYKFQWTCKIYNVKFYYYIFYIFSTGLGFHIEVRELVRQATLQCKLQISMNQKYFWLEFFSRS